MLQFFLDFLDSLSCWVSNLVVPPPFILLGDSQEAYDKIIDKHHII